MELRTWWGRNAAHIGSMIIVEDESAFQDCYKRKKMETPNEIKASPGNNLRNRGAVGNDSKKDMIFRADRIDLKNLDIQLEKHLSRVWSRNIEKNPKPKEEWEIELAKLEMSNVIARGAYGIVYKGIYDGQDVAVKVLDWGEDGYATTAETSALRASFRQEVGVWHKLNHPNVTKFVGASMGTTNLKIPSSAEMENSLPQRACCVVVEYLPGGTLKQYLFRNRRRKLAIRVVVQLALDLSRGLSYLHSERIVHRDVKTENMLLDYQRNLKIADFGVARVEAQNPKDMTGETGTLGYMAPEVLDGKPYNRRCDVYSFGICLWEIYCCAMPYPDLSFADVSSAVVRQNLRPDIPRCCPTSLSNIMKRCWDANPVKRPEMEEVVKMLEGVDTSKGGGMIPEDQRPGCFCFVSGRVKKGTSSSLMTEFLEKCGGYAVVDGGFATELERHGADIKDPLWSAKCLITSPHLVTKVHLDYLESGANIIITASYQATIQGFVAKGLSVGEAESLLRRSVELSCEAREIFYNRCNKGSWDFDHVGKASRRPVLVAASVGSYGAYLADGSEYSGVYGDSVSKESLKDFHRRRVQILAKSGADLIAFETIPNKLEAEAYVDLLEEEGIDIPAWFAFTSKDGVTVPSGESIIECAEVADSCKKLVAIGINCTAPRYISDLVISLRQVTHKPIIVYPNSGEVYDGLNKKWIKSEEESEEDFVSYVSRWREEGASLFGGCCRTTPNTIKAITNVLSCESSAPSKLKFW
ncbi:hypothetical protein HID58_093486 [Brassica napus]|uniref:Protein kinase domain-containing protein n=1 Tax=Brassica napus TaxID=3708 RepID=A0ABQ7XCH1_BRANA|nr:hypothetical protein HID58_093486 [Brassica napus]